MIAPHRLCRLRSRTLRALGARMNRHALRAIASLSLRPQERRLGGAGDVREGRHIGPRLLLAWPEMVDVDPVCPGMRPGHPFIGIEKVMEKESSDRTIKP